MINLSNLFAEHKFHSSEIKKEELEDFLKQVVSQEFPLDEIVELVKSDNGLTIILKSGQSIVVDIDWQEFILR